MSLSHIKMVLFFYHFLFAFQSEIAREFFLGEFSFEELKYVPANHSKGDNKELADLIIDYSDKTIAFQIKGRRGEPVPGGLYQYGQAESRCIDCGGT